MIEPHGGELVRLMAQGAARDALSERAASLPAVDLTPRQTADLELLAVGGLSPLRGFQGSDDWRRVVDEMRLADGLPWSIPITLACALDAAEGDEVALRFGDRLLGVMTVEELFERDLEREARGVYRTDDRAHPGVAAMLAEGSRCLAGPVRAVALPEHPAAMRYAGPREAIFHALIRKNYGCTHFIVGRDHAGVGDYYGTYDAQEIFSEFEPQELGIEPLMFDHAFYCRITKGMATSKTSPAGPEDRVFLSGTKVRDMLAAGERPPEEFTRPEVADILIEAMRGERAAVTA